MQLAKRMNRLGTETAFEVLAEVKKLEEEGREIISFAIGEPDFNTPANVKEEGMEAIKNDYTHYSPAAGLNQLRCLIAGYIKKTRHIEVKPEEVVVMPGAKPLIFHGLLALANQGDEVIYPNPGFPIYESVINFVGAKPVPLPLREEMDFSFDIDELEKLLSDRTAGIIVNSPNNPTGSIIGKRDMELLARIAIENNLWVISDEVYSQMLYEEDFCSISSFPAMKERTLIIDGFSKTYSMTGWRIGYGVGNEELINGLTRLEINCESCTATFTQLAAIEALSGSQKERELMHRELKKRRDVMVAGLNNIDGIKCIKPKGSFYVFPNVTEACKAKGLKNANELQQHLLYNGSVALLGRSCFGEKNRGEKDEYLRISYATSFEKIEEGLRRIGQALK